MERTKIKKLELPYCNPQKGVYSSGAGIIQMIDKINEIIDILNEPQALVLTKEDCEKLKDKLRKTTYKRIDERDRIISELN